MNSLSTFIRQIIIPISSCILVMVLFSTVIYPLTLANPISHEVIIKLTKKKIIISYLTLALLALLNNISRFKNIKIKQFLQFKINEDKLNSQNYFSQISVGLLIGLSLLVFSNWSNIPYAFASKTRFADFFFIGILFFTPFFLLNKNVFRPLLYSCYFILLASLLSYTKLTPVFTDDHAAVIYRLSLLSEHFPNIPVYNTHWNAGVDWRDFFATGILNVFLIFYIPIKILGSITAYGLIVPSIIFIILPLSLFISCRLLGLSKLTSSLSSILGITSTIIYYKWSLSYGSLGFVCSTSLVPLAATCLILIINKSKNKEVVSPNLLLSTCLLCTLCFFWSMQVVALLPLLLLTLFSSSKTILSSKKLLSIALIFIIINLIWAGLFYKVSKVGSFITAKHSIESMENATAFSTKIRSIAKFSTETPYDVFKINILRANPLITIFFIPGLLYSVLNKNTKFSFSILFFWLLFIGLIGPAYKAQLELDRFIVILLLIASIPAAAFLGNVVENNNGVSNKISRILLASFILCSAINFSSIFQNRGWFAFKLLPKELTEIANTITKFSGDGRAIFSGFILHDLNGGHLAPIAQLTKTPLIGSSPVHNLWWYTDIIPQEFRAKGPEGIENYYELYNVTLTIAHESSWKKYFRERPEMYKEVFTINKFVFFQRSTKSNYFISGSGEILSQTNNKITLNLNSNEAIIKFTYFPFLTASGCKEISSQKYSDSIEFIKLEGCKTDETIEIKSINPILRFLKK